MDKYEYKLKTEQLLELIGKGAYKKAAELADTIDWRRVRNVSMLMKVSAVYERNKEYNKSYSVLSLAYRRAEGSRKIISKLCTLALKAGKVDEAENYYDDFVQIAPKDPNKYILKYQLLRAEKAPIEQQIEVLEEYKKSEYIEEWAYELAKLYQEAGMTAECLEECDDLILWFSEGKYVYKAMELKMQYKPLTPSQQEKYDRRFEKNSGDTEEMPDISAYVESRKKQEKPQKEEVKSPELSDSGSEENQKTHIEEQEVKSEKPDENKKEQIPPVKKKIGNTMPLDEALRQLLHPEKTQEVQADQEPELQDLEQEIDEIESVADVDMIKHLASERKKKASLPKGEMKEIRPDDAYEIDGQLELDDILTDWEGTPNLGKENTDDVTGKEFTVEEIVEEVVEELPAEDTEEIVEGTAEEFPEEDTEEIVEGTAEELPEEDTEEIVEETVDELPEEDTEEIVEGTAEELPEEDEEEVVEETVDELPEEDAEEILEETAEELPEEDAEEIVEESAEELPEEDAEEIVEESAEELPEEDAEEIVEEAAEELPEEDVEEIVEEAAEELPEEDAEEVVEETVDELPEEDAEEIVEEAAEELPEEDAEASGAENIEQEDSIDKGETEGEPMDQKTKKIEPILPPDIQRMIDEIEGVIPPQEEEKKPVRETRKTREPLENMGKVADSLRIDEEFDEDSGFLDEEEEFDEGEEFWDDEFLEDEEDLDEEEFFDEGENLLEEDEKFEEEELSEEDEEFEEEELPEEDEEFEEEELPEEDEEFEEGELPEDDEFFDEGEEFIDDEGEELTDSDEGFEETDEVFEEDEEADTEVQDLDEEFRVNPEHAAMADDREIPDDDDDNMDILSATTPLSRKETAKLIATGKTSPLPLDEISDALSMTDTGFIVHGRYDLGIQSGIGTRAGLTEEQKKLFSYFVPVRGMSEQLVDVLEQDKNCTNRKGTSRTGNLLIVGNKGNGKTVLAVDVVKAIQKQRKIHQGKVAIVSGDSLNKKKIGDIFDKLYGGALIIEKAGKMNEKTVARLNKAMEKNTGELLVVLEEQRKPIDRLLSSNREFRKKFTCRLEVPIFINDELVTFGQTYAQENGYRIDEMGILALYSKIDSLQREDHAVTVAEVKEIMDEAIQHSQKASAKKLVKRVFGKNTDDADRILLSEKDFHI